MTLAATNKALLKVLGIDQPLITALQIHMQPNKLPVVTMDCLIDSKAMLHEVSYFDLVLREEPAPEPAPRPVLDLDAMCAQARATLASEVDFHGTTTMAAQLRESAAIRARLDHALQFRRAAAAQALANLARRPLWGEMLQDLISSGWPFAGTIGGLSTLGNGGPGA